MENTEALNNQEAQYGQPAEPEQQAQPVAENENVAEPADLADAFAALRAQNAPGTDSSVAATEEQQQPAEQQYAPVDTGSYADYRGPASYEPPTNWSAKDAEMKRNIQKLSIQTVTEQWRQQGKRPIEIDELTRRDEQTGRLYYIDIYDDPQEWNKPGYQGVDKATARQHMKEFNEDLQASWNKEVIQAQRNYAQTVEPIRRLYAFGPTYDKLDEETKDVLAQLVDPYEIVDKDGRSWGFNCDLNAALKQAQGIVNSTRARYGSYIQQQQQAAQQQQVRQPAVDARSSAGGNRQSAPSDPKDINDAIMMFEKMQRENRKAGK